jgi:hypothetical protein
MREQDVSPEQLMQAVEPNDVQLLTSSINIAIAKNENAK